MCWYLLEATTTLNLSTLNFVAEKHPCIFRKEVTKFKHSSELSEPTLNATYVAKLEGVLGQFDGTDAPPAAGTDTYEAWRIRNTIAKMLVTFTIPDSLLIDFLTTEIAQDMFTRLENKFGNSITATAIQSTPSPTSSFPNRESRRKRDKTNREPKRKVERDREISGEDRECDMRGQRRVEKRDRRGKRAARWTSEQGAAVREPGEEATDETTRSVSLAVTPSSQDVDSRDIAVPCQCTTVEPHKPETTHPTAGEATADTVNPNATSVGPPEPVGAMREPQDEPQEPTDKEQPPSMPLEGGRDAGGQMTSGHADEGASSNPVEPAGANTSNTTAAARSHGASSATAESANSTHVAQQHSANARGEEDYAQAKQPHMPGNPPSILLEGEHSAQKDMNGTRAGQQLDTSAHGEGRSARAEWHSSMRAPDGITEDPGGRGNPSALARPPSTPLEGERGHQPSSGHADDRTAIRVHRGDSTTGGSRRSCMDSVTSDTTRDSKQVRIGLLAAAKVRQDHHDGYMHRRRNDVPEPCTPPTKHPKRPVEPTNPPRRRGRLKTRPTRDLQDQARRIASPLLKGRAPPIAPICKTHYDLPNRAITQA
ncbi:hypothetical protein BU15DRAFT_68042 [Melanogaster broomeanus]|nr:hypothetical protein BU15DRAFT_68042 [Melanogaster broomeanus]